MAERGWSFRVLTERLYKKTEPRMTSGAVMAEGHHQARQRAAIKAGVAPEHVQVKELPKCRIGSDGELERIG